MPNQSEQPQQPQTVLERAKAALADALQRSQAAQESAEAEKKATARRALKLRNMYSAIPITEILTYKEWIQNAINLAEEENISIDGKKINGALTQYKTVAPGIQERVEMLSRLQQIAEIGSPIVDQKLVEDLQEEIRNMETGLTEPHQIIVGGMRTLFESLHKKFRGKETSEAKAYRELFEKLHKNDPEIPREIAETPEAYRAAIEEEFLPPAKTEERLAREQEIRDGHKIFLEWLETLPKTQKVSSSDFEKWIPEQIVRAKSFPAESDYTGARSQGLLLPKVKEGLEERGRFNARECVAVQTNREIIQYTLRDADIEELKTAYAQVREFKAVLQTVDQQTHPDVIKKSFPTHPLAQSLIRRWLTYAMPFESLRTIPRAMSINALSSLAQFRGTKDFYKEAGREEFTLKQADWMQRDRETPEDLQNILNIRIAEWQARKPFLSNFPPQQEERPYFQGQPIAISMDTLSDELQREGWTRQSTANAPARFFVAPNGDVAKAEKFYLAAHNRIEEAIGKMATPEPTTIDGLRRKQEAIHEAMRTEVDSFLGERGGKIAELEEKNRQLSEELAGLKKKLAEKDADNLKLNSRIIALQKELDARIEELTQIAQLNVQLQSRSPEKKSASGDETNPALDAINQIAEIADATRDLPVDFGYRTQSLATATKALEKIDKIIRSLHS